MSKKYDMVATYGLAVAFSVSVICTVAWSAIVGCERYEYKPLDRQVLKCGDVTTRMWLIVIYECEGGRVDVVDRGGERFDLIYCVCDGKASTAAPRPIYDRAQDKEAP